MVFQSIRKNNIKLREGGNEKIISKMSKVESQRTNKVNKTENVRKKAKVSRQQNERCGQEFVARGREEIGDGEREREKDVSRAFNFLSIKFKLLKML